MAYKIVYRKRFLKNVAKITSYIENEWGYAVAVEFATTIEARIIKLTKHPFIGNLQGRKSIRSVIAGKHNRLYYRLIGKNLVVSNIIDMRINPKRNPYSKK